MTNELKNAIEIVKEYLDMDLDVDSEYLNAQRTIINALEAQSNRCDSCTHSEEQDGSNCYECVKGMADNFEAQPSEDTEVIKISKGAVKTRQGRYVIYDVEWLKENFYTTEEKIYGQPKQPCEDCISKEAVDALIDELARAISDERCFISRGRDTATIMQDILNLPSVTPRTNLAETSQDCISREAVEKLKKYSLSYDTNTTVPKTDIFVKIADIKHLPSVIPQRKRGRWIFDAWGTNCSECGYKPTIMSDWAYCPNCGCYMGGDSE